MYESNLEPDTDIDEMGTWLSIGDLMSALLMFFALILVVALFQLREVIERQATNRVIIIQALEKNLNEAGIQAKIDPHTGDITVLDSVLFEYGSSIMKPAGHEFLSRFIPIYGEVIFTNAEIAKEVQYIVVEGHTSSHGSYAYNMSLSLRRADAVAKAVSKIEFPGKSKLLNKMLVSGRGEIESNSYKDTASDRKVLFRFQFASDSFVKWFDANLKVSQ
jgi:outer membrane protein OmpA-like peptidoglycan-associated protein